MNILVTAATKAEIAPLLAYLTESWATGSDGAYTKAATRVRILITGVGMVATAYHLTKALNRSKYDFALLFGIAGSFDGNIALGDVVFIHSERFGDMGAEDQYCFHDIFDLGLEQLQQPPFNQGALLNPEENIPAFMSLPRVTSITINSVSGTSFTATSRFEKYQSQVESMEGGAFHYVCLLEKVPFAQVRSISNYVEARDKSKWRINEAIDSLNKWAISFLQAQS